MAVIGRVPDGRRLVIPRSCLLDLERPDDWRGLLGHSPAWVHPHFYRDPAGRWAVGITVSPGTGVYGELSDRLLVSGPINTEAIEVVDDDQIGAAVAT